MLDSTQRQKIKKALFSWPYNFSFIAIFLLFVVLNIFLNGTYEILTNLGTLRFWFAFSFVLLLFLVSVMFSLTINLAIIRIKDLGSVNSKEGGFAFLGGLGGVIGGSCPACLAGLFPAVMGLLGLSFSLTDLPFNGLEIQVVSIILLSISIFMLSKNPVCSIDFSKKS